MRKLLYIWILLPLCIACERDLMSYEGEEAIYFAVQTVADFRHSSSIEME